MTRDQINHVLWLEYRAPDSKYTGSIPGGDRVFLSAYSQ